MPVTRWTVIARLHSDDDKQVRRALNDLCSQYHYPLYCYIRRRGFDHHDAMDALHDFLSKFLRLQSFQSAKEEKGRLRSLLLVSLQRFLENWKKIRNRKHESSYVSLSMFDADHEQYQKELFTDTDSPDRIYQRKWAQELLSGVMQQLRQQYHSTQRGALFDMLQPVLVAGGSLKGEDTDAMSRALGMRNSAFRVALNRLLRDYRNILKWEVVQTIADPKKVEDEIKELRSALSR